MKQSIDSNDQESPAKPKRPSAIRWVAVIVVVVMVGAAFVLASRPVPGQRTTTETSVHVVIVAAKGDATSAFPIALQEGGDAEHEADHVIEPLQGLDGVTSAKLDWSSGLVLTVEFDSAVVSAQEIANAIAKSGYLANPEGQ
jgi:copper chaperone CopZ